MSYFQITAVRYGTIPDGNPDWNQAEIVFKGDNDVFPWILAAMVEQKMVTFPSSALVDFAKTTNISRGEVVTKGKSLILTFAIYGKGNFSLEDIRKWAAENVLPELEAKYKRVDEIRGILLVLKVAEETKA